MMQATKKDSHPVSPTMVRSVFVELKSNGYSDHQICALSAGLMSMAGDQESTPAPADFTALADYAENTSDGLFLFGYPDGFETLCSKSTTR